MDAENAAVSFKLTTRNDSKLHLHETAPRKMCNRRNHKSYTRFDTNATCFCVHRNFIQFILIVYFDSKMSITGLILFLMNTNQFFSL